MNVAEFDYELPEELIAQHPNEKRDESRLMVLNREKQTIEHKIFKDIIDYLEPGDCLVINNTKVILSLFIAGLLIFCRIYLLCNVFSVFNIAFNLLFN